MSDAKTRLRETILSARAVRPDAARRDAGRALATAALTLIGELAPRRVAAYAATPTEPDTSALLDALHANGVEVVLPVVRADGLLDWAGHAPGDALPPSGRFGLPEPSGPRLGPDALSAAGIAFVPALAVDSRGNRLGRGGGFFDRCLARYRPPAVFAVVYDEEVVDAVPVTEHDQPVDGALTPSGARRWLRGS